MTKEKLRAAVYTIGIVSSVRATVIWWSKDFGLCVDHLVQLLKRQLLDCILGYALKLWKSTMYDVTAILIETSFLTVRFRIKNVYSSVGINTM